MRAPPTGGAATASGTVIHHMIILTGHIATTTITWRWRSRAAINNSATRDAHRARAQQTHRARARARRPRCAPRRGRDDLAARGPQRSSKCLSPATCCCARSCGVLGAGTCAPTVRTCAHRSGRCRGRCCRCTAVPPSSHADHYQQPADQSAGGAAVPSPTFSSAVTRLTMSRLHIIQIQRKAAVHMSSAWIPPTGA